MPDPTFAQAQQRLAERRRFREAQTQARLAAERSASQLRGRISSHPSLLFRNLGGSAISLWDTISSREGTRPAFRVGQVDAELLDEELVQLLRNQVGDGLRYLGGGLGNSLKDDWSAEILLALRAALFKLTVWDHDATYGAALQNLKYTDARRDGPVLLPPTRAQKSLYGLVTVGGKYAWARLETWLRRHDDGFHPPSPQARTLSGLASAAESIHAVAAFASFLVFLLHGRYRTLLDRILRMRLAQPTSQVSREVSLEYLNRQLVWHALTEFLLFVLPLIGIDKWRRWMSRTWRKARKTRLCGTDVASEVKEGELAFLPERTCAICYQDQTTASTEQDILAAAASSGVVGSSQTDITNPYETIPCACVYCFVCLATRIGREEDEGWTCLRCGEQVKECKPWSGDILEPSNKSATVKAVMFADDVKDAGPPTDTDTSESSQAEFVDATEDRSETSQAEFVDTVDDLAEQAAVHSQSTQQQ